MKILTTDNIKKIKNFFTNKLKKDLENEDISKFNKKNNYITKIKFADPEIIWDTKLEQCKLLENGTYPPNEEAFVTINDSGEGKWNEGYIEDENGKYREYTFENTSEPEIKFYFHNTQGQKGEKGNEGLSCFSYTMQRYFSFSDGTLTVKLY